MGLLLDLVLALFKGSDVPVYIPGTSLGREVVLGSPRYAVTLCRKTLSVLLKLFLDFTVLLDLLNCQM